MIINKISVVMAIFNGEKYLHDQINSIKIQTLRPDEIIFVDDCSKEDPSPLINEILKNSSIQYTILRNHNNKGYNFSFRKGMKAASGDIIFLSDQDDIWLESKIEKIYGYFKANNNASVVINDCLFLRDGEVSGENTKAQTILNFSGTIDHFVAGCCTSFDRVVLNAVNQGLYEDLNYDDQIHNIGKLLNRRFFHYEPLQLYRRHLDNESKIPQNDGGELSYLRRIYNKINYEFIKFFFIELIVLRSEEQETFSQRLKILQNSDISIWSSQSELLNLIIFLKNKLKFTYIFKSKNWNYVFFRVFFGICIVKLNSRLKNI
jgi:glycosyltransferase involved in cell wall biosynthesis